MSIENYRYSVLYKLSVILKINSSLNNEGYINLQIPNSDIVSIAMIHNYDEATFPIIRLRIYTDLTNMLYLTEDPDDINVSITMNGNVYRMNDSDDKSPTPVAGAENIDIHLKGYIENKNIPTSIMDKYDNGSKRENDLNDTRKVPIELYCYDDKLLHFMRSRAQAIYKDMTIQSIVEAMFRNQGIVNIDICPFNNQKKYNQILIPNLNITDSLAFFESMYGIYQYGGHIYGDVDKFYITSSDTEHNEYHNTLPIFVESYKNNSDMGGMRKVDSLYRMNTKAENVSILTETDVERIMHAEIVNAVDVGSYDNRSGWNTNSALAYKLYPDLEKEIKSIAEDTKSEDGSIQKYLKVLSEKFCIPDILHKSKNENIAYTVLARVYEKMTRIDVSGVGFDIGKMKINTRYNLVFDTPIRGRDVNQLYRATYATHVFTNLSSDLFIAQTTMNLCNNSHF